MKKQDLQKVIFKKAIIEFSVMCIKTAHRNNQVVGEKNDYYLTLQQIEYLLQSTIKHNL